LYNLTANNAVHKKRHVQLIDFTGLLLISFPSLAGLATKNNKSVQADRKKRQ